MRLKLTIILACALCLVTTSNAEVPDPDPNRFAQGLQVFPRWDSKNSFPANATLFIGSSSIRLWPTATAFPGKAVINRGFGGSELSDVIYFYTQLVKPYAPSRIVLYAGDNDIAAGKSAEQVFEDYKEFVALVRSDFPDTELLFISIKPSKLRWNLWPAMMDANNLISEYAGHEPALGYVDLATPLLNEDGVPKDVYLDDGLHLSEAGYALWQQAMAPYLD